MNYPVVSVNLCRFMMSNIHLLIVAFLTNSGTPHFVMPRRLPINRKFAILPFMDDADDNTRSVALD